MSIRINCITKDAGNHENPHVAISHLGWINENTQERGYSTREIIYDFVKNGNTAYVKDAFDTIAKLMCAISSRETKYVKTVADETKTDNLLKLQECK